jgi:hypothetical protein
MNLFHYPMPRITLGVLAGCVLGSYTNRLVEAVGFFFISLIVVLGLQLIRSAKWLKGIAILLLAIGIGMLSEGLHRECYYPNHYTHFCKNGKKGGVSGKYPALHIAPMHLALLQYG